MSFEKVREGVKIMDSRCLTLVEYSQLSTIYEVGHLMAKLKLVEPGRGCRWWSNTLGGAYMDYLGKGR